MKKVRKGSVQESNPQTRNALTMRTIDDLYTICRPHQRQEVAWVKVRSPMRFSPALDSGHYPDAQPVEWDYSSTTLHKTR